MKDVSSIVLDMIHQSKFLESMMAYEKLEETKFIKNYNLLMSKLNDEQKEILQHIKLDFINFFDEKEYYASAVILNIGMKIGIEFQDILYEIN